MRPMVTPAVAMLLAARLFGASAARLPTRGEGPGGVAGRLLQAAARGAAAGGRTSAPLPQEFFSEDADRMAAMPSYADARPLSRPGHHGGRPPCTPQCTWRCGPEKECDQVCEPVCMPPECKTICRQTAKTCETRCAPPQCAVVCPHEACAEGGRCAKCGTVCNEPVCTTHCGDSCESVCEKPRCAWKCHAGLCPKPQCQMDCSGLQPCTLSLPLVNKSQPLPSLRKEVVAEAPASLDVRALMQPLEPPAPWVVKGPAADALPAAAPPRAAAAAAFRRKARSHSVPSIAAPYAVPVVPPAPTQVAGSGRGAPVRGGGARRGNPHAFRGAELPYSQHDPMEDDLGSFIAHALGDGDDGGMGGEHLLASIDQLYNQVLGSRDSLSMERTTVPNHTYSPHGFQGLAEFPGNVIAAGSGNQSCSDNVSEWSVPRGAMLQQPPANPGMPPPPVQDPSRHSRHGAMMREATGAPEGAENGEALLASIDRLYGEMLHRGPGAAIEPGTRGAAGVARAATRPAGTPAVGSAAAAAPSATQCQEDHAWGPSGLPVSATTVSDGDTPSSGWAEVHEVLVEVLWSALLMGRGTGGRIDMQEKLLEMLPSDILAQSIHAKGHHSLPPSLLQRLQTELPRVHSALIQPPNGACTAAAASELAQTLREARDGLLSLASSEVSMDDLAAGPCSAEHLAPGESASTLPFVPDAASKSSSLSASANLQGSRLKKPKPRRTSLSYWTPESLDSLEPRNR